MSRESYHGELRVMEQGVVDLARRVQAVLSRAMEALARRDAPAARAIIAGDQRIDEDQRDLEMECLRLIALQQPVADDLRSIAAALHLLIDVERIGDHGADIARATLRMPVTEPVAPLPEGIAVLATLARGMVARAMDAFVRRDPHLAGTLLAMDDQADRLYAQVFHDLVGAMAENAASVERGTQLLLVASYLERVADHATNLAEAAIYAATGEQPELND